MDLTQTPLAANPAFGPEVILLALALAALVGSMIIHLCREGRRANAALPGALPIRIAEPVGAGPWAPRRSACRWQREGAGGAGQIARWRCETCGADGVGLDGTPPELCNASLRSRPV